MLTCAVHIVQWWFKPYPHFTNHTNLRPRLTNHTKPPPTFTYHTKPFHFSLTTPSPAPIHWPRQVQHPISPTTSMHTLWLHCLAISRAVSFWLFLVLIKSLRILRISFMHSVLSCRAHLGKFYLGIMLLFWVIYIFLGYFNLFQG